MARRSQHLQPFSQTIYPSPSPVKFPSVCPVLDLSATVDKSNKNVLIFRADREQVCKLAQGGRIPSVVTATRWKPDGQFISVAWKDGIVRLMGIETGKAAHQIPVTKPGQGDITYLAWTTTKISPEGSPSFNPSLPPLLSPSLLSALASATALGIPDDDKEQMDSLPLEIMFMDMEIPLPKLSPLPTTSAGSGEDALVFTQRSGVDFMFQPFNPKEAKEVSVLLAGLSNGEVHLSIHDSLPIGTFTYRSSTDEAFEAKKLELIHHVSHHEVSSQILIFRQKSPDRHAIEIVPLDMQFIATSPINLSLLASKLTMMHKLIRYIKQTILHIQVEYNNTRDLPTRFLNSAISILQEDPSGQQDLVTVLYQALLMGCLPSKMREWLMDSMGTRNLARWSKVITSGLKALRILIQQHLLPALNRLTIVTSRLNGLADFHGSQNTGLNCTTLRVILDLAASLSLVVNRVLLIIMEESLAWRSFFAWISFTLEKLMTPSTADELSEKCIIDTSQVALYLLQYLMASPMAPHITTDLGDGSLDKIFSDLSDRCAQEGNHIMEVIGGILNKEEELEGLSEKAKGKLVTLGEITGQLDRRVRGVLDGVAEAQQKSVKFGEGVVVPLGAEVADVHAQLVLRENSTAVIYSAILVKDEPTIVTLHRVTYSLYNGLSTFQSSDTSTIIFPSSPIAVQVLHDKLLVLVTSSSNKPYTIYTIPLAPIPWGPPDAPPISVTTLDILSPMVLPGTLKPVAMEVLDKSTVRSILPTRVCLLDESRMALHTFSVDLE